MHTVRQGAARWAAILPGMRNGRRCRTAVCRRAADRNGGEGRCRRRRVGHSRVSKCGWRRGGVGSGRGWRGDAIHMEERAACCPGDWRGCWAGAESCKSCEKFAGGKEVEVAGRPGRRGGGDPRSGFRAVRRAAVHTAPVRPQQSCRVDVRLVSGLVELVFECFGLVGVANLLERGKLGVFELVFERQRIAVG